MVSSERDVREQVQRLTLSRRRSLRALPALTILMICATALYADLPSWGSAAVVGVLGFPWVGDVINVLWITWRLRRLSTQLDRQ
jgi:hypothetical protein